MQDPCMSRLMDAHDYVWCHVRHSTYMPLNIHIYRDDWQTMNVRGTHGWHYTLKCRQTMDVHNSQSWQSWHHNHELIKPYALELYDFICLPTQTCAKTWFWYKHYKPYSMDHCTVLTTHFQEWTLVWLWQYTVNFRMVVSEQCSKLKQGLIDSL